MVFVGDFIPKKATPTIPDVGDQWLVANLEGPVCADGLVGLPKIGVHLHSAPFAVPGKLAFALANNHMMDFGVEGLRQTKEFLASKGYPCAGAGMDVQEARKPLVLEEGGKRIGLISCCERQFGVATETAAGVAAKGEWLFVAIAELKRMVDFVVVSCHVASEFSTAVSPRLQSFYHSLIEAGADVIHGHHAHVPQGWETYKGHPIFYGMGNFVVDRAAWQSTANGLWSLVAHVDFSGEKLRWTVEPYGEVPLDAEKYLARANLGFEHSELLEALWQESSIRLYHRLYEQNLRAASVESHKLSLKDRIRKVYFAWGDLLRVLSGREFRTETSRHYGRVLYNFVNCESHVDMIATALGVLTGSREDERVRLKGWE